MYNYFERQDVVNNLVHLLLSIPPSHVAQGKQPIVGRRISLLRKYYTLFFLNVSGKYDRLMLY